MDECYKVKYSRPKNCMNAIQRILASGKIIERIGFYKCPFCDGWHISHRFGTADKYFEQERMSK
jgi:hypothetical protein